MMLLFFYLFAKISLKQKYNENLRRLDKMKKLNTSSVKTILSML